MTPQFRTFVHIGTEKTGTTTLQHLLHQSAEILLHQGYFYYSTPGRVESRALQAAALGDKGQDDFLRSKGIETPDQRQQFRKEVAAHFHETIHALPSHVHTLILSSEHFHSRLRKPEQVKWLYDLVAPFSSEIQIVAYLRRQVDLAASYYSTELKNGGKRALEIAARKACNPQNHYYNYERLLFLWADIFGVDSICPRLFVTEQLVDRDISSDFEYVLDLPAKILSHDKDSCRHNESLTPLGQHLLLGLNKHVHAGKDAVDHREGEALSKKIRQLFVGSGQKLPFDLAAELQDAFVPSNAAVCEKWFLKRKQLFAPLVKADCAQPAQIELSLEQQKLIADLISYLRPPGSKRVSLLNPCADILRDLAVKLESRDIFAARDAMSLALQIRPHGPFIRRKMEEYEHKCAQPGLRFKCWFQKCRKHWRR